MSDGELAVVDETSTTTPTVLHDQFDLVDVEGAKAFMTNYQETIKALLTDKDYQTIAGKDFKKKSAWRKLATAFRISDEVIDEKLEFDETGQIVSARYRVKAMLPNGRSTEGVGVCTIYDKIRYHSTKNNDADTETPSNFILRGRFSNAEHDVPSTAHTRAKNRAISDLIGAGDVSAEEMGEIRESAPRKTRKGRASDTNNNSNGGSDEPKSKGRKRGRRQAAAPKEENVVEAEIVETTAEVVENTTSSSSDFKDIDNDAIKTCIQRIENRGEEITKSGLVDELFDRYNFGDINEDQYYEAKRALGLDY